VSVNTANGSSTSYTSSQQLLVNAFDRLGQADSLKADLHLDISQGLLSQLEASSGGSSTSIALGEKLLQSHIIISESSNGPLANVTSTTPAAVDFTIVTGGSTLAEFRVVDGNLYARADLSTIASWAGQSLSTLQGQLSTAPSQVRTWLQAAINGDWLELSKQQLTAVDGLLQQRASASTGAAGSLTPAQAKQLVQEIESVTKGVFVKDVSVADKGATSKGEELVLTADARTSLTDIVNGVLPILQRIYPSLSASMSASQLQQGLTQVPHRNVTADAFVSNGSLSELSLDVLQFAPPNTPNIAGQHMTVVYDFTPNTGAVTAPSGATQLDLTSLLSALGGSMGL
jgi:hypothetical protein